MRLYAFHCGGAVVPRAVMGPGSGDAAETVEIPYFFYLIRHAAGNVLFDCGPHPSLADRPGRRLGPVADTIEIRVGRSDGVVEQLAAIGLTPADVDLVIQSHLHFDHAGGLAFLPSAPVLVHEDELGFASEPPADQGDMYVAADFEPVTDWRPIRGQHDVFGDGTLVVFPTPGHSRGHQSLLVRLPRRPVILVADAAYTRQSLDESVLPGIVWSPEAMIDSWARIRRLRDEQGASLLFAHDPGYATTTELAPGRWYE